jgi:glycosyltransferase involved in cell wall biosynthesis
MSYVKNVLYINPQSAFSGAEVTMFDLMVNLDCDLFKPILLCRNKGPLVERCNEKGITTYFLPSLPPSGSPVCQTYRSILVNALWIAHLVRRANINLVHSNSPRMAYHGGLGARLSGVHSVTHIRDYYNSPFQSALKSRFLNKVSDYFIAVSKAVRNAVCSWAPYLSGKIDVVYDGINEISFSSTRKQAGIRKELKIADDDKLVGVVGSINKLKGQSTAIQALSEVSKLIPNVYLVIAGGTFDLEAETYFRTLEKQIDELGLRNRVKFVGNRSDIADIMAELDILVHPAVLPEALGHVLLEASIFKKPIIASNIGGIPEIIKHGETGLLFAPGKSDDLAKAIIWLIDNPQENKRLGQGASEFVKANFSMKQYVDGIESIYDRVL